MSNYETNIIIFVGGFTAYVMSSDGSMLTFSSPDKGVDYAMTADQKAAAEQQINSVVAQLTAQAEKLNSRFEKEKLFHDWLCNNVVYLNDGTDDVYTVYGALVKGVAVCEGYSRAMQLLCDSVGIPCTLVYGESKGVGHMWNIINPGDGWYHLDVTWDDDATYNRIRYAYFNLTDKQILVDHTIFEAVAAGKSYVGTDYFNLYLYSCNSASYNYFTKNKLIFGDDIKAAAQLIADARSKGLYDIELLYTGSNKDYASVLMQLNSTLYESGSGIQVKSFSPLGNAIVLWW